MTKHTKERLFADYRDAANAYRVYRKANGLPVRRPSFARTTQAHVCLGVSCHSIVFLKDGKGRRLGRVTVIGYSPTELYTSVTTRRGFTPKVRVELP